MLRFVTPPDKMFGLLVHDALDHMLQYVDRFRDVPAQQARSVRGALPRTAARFQPQHIIEQVYALQVAFTDTQVYPLTDDQEILLYECLDLYCAILEEFPEYGRIAKDCGVEFIDLEALVHRYFRHTHFLYDRIADADDEGSSAIEKQPCGRCGKWDLEQWFTSTQDGTVLCRDCFKIRCAQGLAKEVPDQS